MHRCIEHQVSTRVSRESFQRRILIAIRRDEGTGSEGNLNSRGTRTEPLPLISSSDPRSIDRSIARSKGNEGRFGDRSFSDPFDDGRFGFGTRCACTTKNIEPVNDYRYIYIYIYIYIHIASLEARLLDCENSIPAFGISVRIRKAQGCNVTVRGTVLLTPMASLRDHLFDRSDSRISSGVEKEEHRSMLGPGWKSRPIVQPQDGTATETYTERI